MLTLFEGLEGLIKEIGGHWSSPPISLQHQAAGLLRDRRRRGQLAAFVVRPKAKPNRLSLAWLPGWIRRALANQRPAITKTLGNSQGVVGASFSTTNDSTLYHVQSIESPLTPSRPHDHPFSRTRVRLYTYPSKWYAPPPCIQHCLRC